ncbi:hypothetical protein FOCC_FOCC009598 [Frankliniella occidentalis]|nr:hypothetical protein FOCC_FOCC009598 [Frankliniella occidentalis]
MLLVTLKHPSSVWRLGEQYLQSLQILYNFCYCSQ